MKILVRGPALTRTGYGEHCRFVLRALRQLDDIDLYLLPVNWGNSNWIWEENEERLWMDQIVKKTALYQQHSKQNNQTPHFDISIQVTIPNEWERIATINIGVTAGIETTKVAPVWIEKINAMDKVITISNHSKNSMLNTVYEGIDKKTGQKAQLKCMKDIEIVHYPVKQFEEINLKIDLPTKFNFLTVAQWGPRKNIENTIRWFVEEFIDNSNVGLVVKAFKKGGSIIDRMHVQKHVHEVLSKYKNRQCKIYLLHGDMTEQEMHSLYCHKNVHCLISLTHGEGFGLPLFEAAYSGLPVLATDWSGHVDFLYKPTVNKKGKEKLKAHYAKVDFDLQPVQKEAIWEGVIQEDSMWAFPQQGSYKMKLREMYKDYGRFKKQAVVLQKWVLKKFTKYNQYSQFLKKALNKTYTNVEVEELPKISIITSVYDGDEFIRHFLEDITKQTVFKEKCELILINANSPGNEEEVINEYLEKYPNNIIYKKLDKDPGIYGVWNYALEFATGEYITNANLDDRKAFNSLETHAKNLFQNKDIDLVYAESFITNNPNETFSNNSSKGRTYSFEEFSKEAMLRGNQPHNNPMWRKSLHDKYGMFDNKYKSAGDWEFFLRSTFGGSKFKKIDQILGLYYFNPKGISTDFKNSAWKLEEEREIWKKYNQMSQNMEKENQGIIL
jgi:glycosyltransferase involved in cell wall biosynthesis